jgi:hypothetical protein
MVGESDEGSWGIHTIITVCGQRKKYHTCKRENEKKDFLEIWYVVEQTVKYVLLPERIKYIAASVVAEYEKEFGNNRIKELDSQVNRLEREINKLVDTAADAPKAARARIFEKIELLDLQKTDIEIDLSKLRIASGIRYTEDEVIAWLKQFCNGDPLDMEFRERIIDVFINSVFLYDDKTVIFYNIKGSKQVSYIEMLEGTEEPASEADLQDASKVRISNAPPRQRVGFVGMDEAHCFVKIC